MVGLGYRREMASWSMPALSADFFEVAPENWIGRDLRPLEALMEAGHPIFLHGVSLNLGGVAPLNLDFLASVRELIQTLGSRCYSDHLAASGDAHALYDLFPVPFTLLEARRIADRIAQVQDFLGMAIAVENITWYTNTGEMPEAEFVAQIVDWADCRLLLDINNLAVNHKNHPQTDSPARFIEQMDVQRVSYLHVAGHEFDARFGLYLDTHSQPVEPTTRQLAQQLAAAHNLPILLEWDNDIPSPTVIEEELQCLKRFLPT